MNRYVVLDFETYPVDGKSYVMEIGCVEVINGDIGESFHTLVRPVAEVSEFVLDLTGISQQELDHAPVFTEVMDLFYNFIQNAVIVAHNANLDCLSYESFCRYLNIEPKTFLWVDSQDIIKMLDPCVQSLQLQTLLTLYKVESSTSHRAKEDAIGLAKLLIYYSTHCGIKLTQREASFLKKSHLPSIRLIIKFLLINFKVELSDGEAVADLPLYNVLNSDEKSQQGNLMAHFNVSSDELLDQLMDVDRRYMVVSTTQSYPELPYIAAPSMYVFPDKIPRLYPVLTDVRVSHIEIVELYGIINWLRQTQSFQLTDLNDQLIQRYHHLVHGVLDTHPLAVANFVRSLLVSYYHSGHLVECNYEMLVLMSIHVPEILPGVSVVLHNFIQFNYCLSQYNEKEFSFSSLKGLSKSILNLAFIIDYLTYLGQDNLKFVQDFARLKSFVHLINEEKLNLFQKADHLVEMLSMNIYGFEKRQVLINVNVFETMEWQELLGALNIVVHYLDEILKLFQKISYYIYSDLNGWFSDLIYEFSYVKKNAQAFLLLPKNGVLYIDSPVKHRASNCRLVIKNVYEHEFYAEVLQYVGNFFVHQQLYDGSSKKQMLQLLGVPALEQIDARGLKRLDINIVFKAQDEIRSLIVREAKQGKLCIAVSSKQRLRFWKQKLRSLVLSQQVDPSIQVSFYTYDRLMGLSDDSVYKLIFPEFLVPDVLQPIHQVRLMGNLGSEDDYLKHIFYEELHMVLDGLQDIDPSSILCNLDVRLKSILSSF